MEDGSSELPYGSPCCRDHSEAVDKVVAPLLKWVVGKAWDVQVTSRWTYVMSALRKIIVACMAKQLLPTALTNMKASMGVDDSMEDTLAKLILADSEDYASRNKMRLMRICRSFGDPSVLWKIAVLISVHGEVDRVLHAILGYATEKKAKLSELVHEGASPIALCQSKVLACVQEWTPASEMWHLFKAMGGNFDSPACKAFARQHLLLASSGLLDYFEMRLEHPPYSLLKLLHEYTSDDNRRGLAESFFAVPEHCLGCFARRMRLSFPTVEALLSSDIHLLRAWGEHSFTGIDFVERSHGQMRTDLRSNTHARNFTMSANRIHCRQVRAEHEARCSKFAGASSNMRGASPNALGGAPGEVAGPIVAAEGASPDGENALPDAIARKSSVPRGGARMAWQNQRIATLKSIIAPHRKLQEAELKELRRRCANEWENMSGEEKRPWKDIDLGRRTQAMVSHSSAPSRVIRPDTGLWQCVSCSDHKSVFPPSEIIQEHASIKKLPEVQQRDDPALRVTRPVPTRSGPADPHPLFGCFAHKKNICRATQPVAVSAQMEVYTKILSMWADKLTVAGVRSCQHLLLIRKRVYRPGDDVLERQLDTIVLLVDGRRRPKMQFFVDA